MKKTLGRHFRLAWIDLSGEESAGSSFAHSPNDAPVMCLRGNGEHNVQMLMTTAKGKLLNALAGYVSAEVLLEELKLARELNQSISGKKLFEQRKLIATKHQKRLDAVENMEFDGVLGQITRGRLTADRKYARDHALFDARSFNTVDMVGNAKTFFGSSTGGVPKGRIGDSMDDFFKKKKSKKKKDAQKPKRKRKALKI